MADKLESIMKEPLAMIDAITNKQMLDASNFDLAVCNRLLSTHVDRDWRILNPIRARKAQLMNAALVEDLKSPLLDADTVKICPSEILSGMLIRQHGYIGKVTEVKRYEDKDNETEPFVYRVYMEYVCGDLAMHKYFISDINNGTAKGYLSVQQGNRKAAFQRVLTD